MAKTPLNKKVDEFFKNYGTKPITEEIVKSSNLEIREINDYGNLLHAVVNYQYPENRVLELIKILMDMGVDVNKKGKNTGLTFIHLSLYGYTDSNNMDHSYSTDFIIKLIELALAHGFNPNIKDSDSETIVDAAIASEVYMGKIMPIIEALGPKFEIGESLESKFNYYLKNSRGSWHKRLLAEEQEIRSLIKKSKFNPDSLKSELDSGVKDLKETTKKLSYEALKKNYKIINTVLNNLKALVAKSVDFEIDVTAYQMVIDETLNKLIAPILSSELDTIEKNPSDEELGMIKEILTIFALADLLKRAENIAANYATYKDNLKEQASSLKCLLETESFLASLDANTNIKDTEIYPELVKMVDKKVKSLNEVIASIKTTLEEKQQIKAHIKDYVDVSSEENNYSYDALDIDALNGILEEEIKEKDSLHQAILDYISLEYTKLKEKLNPLIASGTITIDDITNSFNKSLAKPKSKGKKPKNES